MHELSVCNALISQVEAIAREHGAGRVESITLQLGALSGVEPPLLERAYPLAAAGTLADGAELIIELLPIRVRCRVCGAESDAEPNRLLCGDCGDWQTNLISGDEMLLASVALLDAVGNEAADPLREPDAGLAPPADRSKLS